MRRLLAIASLCLLAASTLASSGAPSKGVPEPTTFSAQGDIAGVPITIIGLVRSNGAIAAQDITDHPCVAPLTQVPVIQFGRVKLVWGFDGLDAVVTVGPPAIPAKYQGCAECHQSQLGELAYYIAANDLVATPLGPNEYITAGGWTVSVTDNGAPTFASDFAAVASALR